MPRSETGCQKQSTALCCKDMATENQGHESTWPENIGTETAVFTKTPKLQRQWPFLSLGEFEGKVYLKF